MRRSCRSAMAFARRDDFHEQPSAKRSRLGDLLSLLAADALQNHAQLGRARVEGEPVCLVCRLDRSDGSPERGERLTHAAGLAALAAPNAGVRAACDAQSLTVTLIRHKTQAAEPLISTVPRDGSEGCSRSAVILPPLRIRRRRRVAEHFERKGVPAAVPQREAELYSGHSLRHGFCTTAAEAGASVQAIMSVTGHKSVPIVMGYTAAADRARISPHRIKGVGLSETGGRVND